MPSKESTDRFTWEGCFFLKGYNKIGYVENRRVNVKERDFTNKNKLTEDGCIKCAKIKTAALKSVNFKITGNNIFMHKTYIPTNNSEQPGANSENKIILTFLALQADFLASRSIYRVK